MRLDQFLRYSRLVKRRPLAKRLADGGAVQVEGKAAKASCRIEAGDVLCLRLGNRRLRVRVLAAAERHPPKKEAQGMFEVIEESVRPADDVEEPVRAPMDFLKRA